MSYAKNMEEQRKKIMNDEYKDIFNYLTQGD